MTTDLSDSEDEAPILGQQPQVIHSSMKTLAGANAGNDAGTAREVEDYEISGDVLPEEPRQTSYSIKHLYEQLEQDEINKRPVYQRAAVWDPERQMNLIDTLYRNYGLPPIYLSRRRLSNNSEVKNCIDGQQRLTSIQNFLNGKIPYADPYTKQKLYFKDSIDTLVKSKSKRKKLLPKRLRKEFEQKQIMCYEYRGLNDLDEMDIFERVQMGMPLSVNEKLRAKAIGTPRYKFIEHVLKTKMNPDCALSALKWDSARANDFKVVALVTLVLEKHNGNKALPGGTDILKLTENWIMQQDALQDDVKEQVTKGFDIFNQLIASQSSNDAIHNFNGVNKKLSPVEFPIVVILVCRLHRKMDLLQLTDAIVNMRKDVRRHHRDIRTNTNVSKTLIAFISKLEEEFNSTGVMEERHDSTAKLRASDTAPILSMSKLTNPRIIPEQRGYAAATALSSSSHLQLSSPTSSQAKPAPTQPFSNPLSNKEVLRGLKFHKRPAGQEVSPATATSSKNHNTSSLSNSRIGFTSNQPGRAPLPLPTSSGSASGSSIKFSSSTLPQKRKRTEDSSGSAPAHSGKVHVMETVRSSGRVPSSGSGVRIESHPSGVYPPPADVLSVGEGNHHTHQDGFMFPDIPSQNALQSGVTNNLPAPSTEQLLEVIRLQHEQYMAQMNLIQAQYAPRGQAEGSAAPASMNNPPGSRHAQIRDQPPVPYWFPLPSRQ